MTSKVGVSAEVVARSMVFEVLFSHSIIAIIGIALVLAAQVYPLTGLAAFIFGLLALTSLAPVAQRILAADGKIPSNGLLWSKVRQRAQRLLIGPVPFSLKNSIWAVSVYGIYCSLQLAFVIFIAESFVDLNLTQAFIVAGAWGLSVTLGRLSFLPVGLGVRDGLAFVLFAQVLDGATAGLIVATSRVVMIAIDLVFVGAVELLALSITVRRVQPQSSM